MKVFKKFNPILNPILIVLVVSFHSFATFAGIHSAIKVVNDGGEMFYPCHWSTDGSLLVSLKPHAVKSDADIKQVARVFYIKNTNELVETYLKTMREENLKMAGEIKRLLAEAKAESTHFPPFEKNSEIENLTQENLRQQKALDEDTAKIKEILTINPLLTHFTSKVERIRNTLTNIENALRLDPSPELKSAESVYQKKLASLLSAAEKDSLSVKTLVQLEHQVKLTVKSIQSGKKRLQQLSLEKVEYDTNSFKNMFANHPKAILARNKQVTVSNTEKTWLDHSTRFPKKSGRAKRIFIEKELGIKFLGYIEKVANEIENPYFHPYDESTQTQPAMRKPVSYQEGVESGASLADRLE